MALWTAEREYETLPLDDYKASRAAYLAASIDATWQGLPLPSLMRWVERQQMDYGPLGALVRSTAIGMALPGLAREGLEALGAPADAFKPQGKVLTAQEVLDRSKPLGLNLRRGMSEAAFESIAAERRRQLANEAVFERARAGTSLQILGVLAEFATGAVDPLNLASAFLPVSRLGPVARALERVGSRDARLFARGASEGAAGAVAVEPLVAAAALDENPAYGFSSGLLNVAFGSALGGGLHWLGGRITGADRVAPSREAATEPQKSAADVLRDTPPEPRAEPAGAAPERAEAPVAPASPVAATPQATARAIEKMSPEARQTLLDTVVRQAANDLTPDVDVLARATGQFVGTPGQRLTMMADLGRRRAADLAALRAEAREFETLRADAARIYGGDAGARLKAPPDFVPTPAQLKAAKDYVTPPRGKAEPETLAQFVRRQGGLALGGDEASSLRAADIGPLSGLLRTRRLGGVKDMQGAKQQLGQHGDDMALLAREAGFYHGERPDLDRFIQDLIDDFNGTRKTYADQDAAAEFATAREARAAFEDWMGRGHAFGDPRDLDPRDLAWWLAHDPTERRLAELDDALARGVISEREALERAALLDAARAADEAAEAQAMLDVIAAARRDMDAAPLFVDNGPLTREEFDAVERSIRDAEARGERLPEGDGRPVDAGIGETARAAGARGEPRAAADPGAVSGRVEARAEGQLDPVTVDLPGWVQRQADWRADAHADAAALKRAEQLVAAREAITPEKDLAELEAAAAKLLTDADKAELKLAEEPYKEATALSDAYAQCKIGGG